MRKSTRNDKWMKELLNIGLKPEIFTIQETDASSWIEDEKYWIKHFADMGANLNNVHKGGWGGAYQPFSELHRKRISNALRGRKKGPLSEETRRKISLAQTGRHKSNGQLGKKHGPMSAERRRNISLAKRGKKINGHGGGKPCSEEHKRRISLALKGRPSPTRGMKLGPLSDEHKRRISEANKGRKRGPLSDEQKKKLSEILTGKKHKPFSEETRERMRLAAKKRYEHNNG